jgi:nitrate reductase gamma subunit
MLGTLGGHAGGLLIPQAWFDRVGFDARAHMAVAYWSGLAVGIAALAGVLLLLRRRLTDRRVRAAGSVNDLVTLGALTLVIAVGLFNVVFGHYNVLDTVAPWIRGIVTFTPEAALMGPVPVSYKVHVLTALALLAYSPFSRLVHIWSAPVTYFVRAPLVFRRRVPEA